MKMWKKAAKFWYSQFKLWRDAYNEVAVFPTSHTSNSAISYRFTNK